MKALLEQIWIFILESIVFVCIKLLPSKAVYNYAYYLYAQWMSWSIEKIRKDLNLDELREGGE